MKQFILSTLILLSASVLYAGSGDTAKDAKGLEVGETAPLFKSSTDQESSFELSTALEKGPVVLFFYRGVWCPYCNRHLASIQQGLPKLYEKGATVVAITPERPEFIEMMTLSTGAKFTIVYDKSYEIAKSYGVNFTPSQKQINFANKKLDADLVDVHQSEPTSLPIPATYIIDSDGKITWRHFDPNYKKRASVEEILDNLP